MNTGHHHCPCCYRIVTRTPKHRIAGHYDTNNQPCPASFEPFDITSIDYQPKAAG